MKILLVQPRQRRGLGFKGLAVVEPLALELVAATLPEHHVQILDLLNEKDLAPALSRFQPDVCGINCSFTVDVYKTLWIAETAKSLRKPPLVVVGGHHATLSPQDFHRPFIDAVVLGEGETTFPELVSCWGKGQDISTIPGLAINSDDAQAITPQRPLIKNLGDRPLPARHLTNTYRRHYFLGFNQPLVVIETARGCPYRCNFCSVWQFYRSTTRSRTPEQVVEEVLNIKERNIFFCDDNFLLNVPRAMEIGLALRQTKVKKHFFIQARSDAIVKNPDFITLWKELGLGGVFIGFEKIDEQELVSVNKKNSIANNERALEMLRAHNIGVTASFIVDPSYGPSEFANLREYVRAHKIRTPSFTILTPLPGTQLFTQLKERLMTANYELFDLFHAVVPTKLELPDFYREFANLYASTYSMRNFGRLGFSGMLDYLFDQHGSIGHLVKVASLARLFGNPACYMAGHVSNM